MKKINLLALSCLAVLNISHAAPLYDHAGHVYVPISFGLLSPDPENNLENGFVGGIGVGYNFTNYFSGQLNGFAFGLSQENNTDYIDPGYYLNAEAHLNAANRTPFTPYGILGAGALKITSTHFAWDYGAGLNAAVSPSLSVDGSWRQLRQTGPSQHNNLYMLGMVWTFGASTAVAAPAPVPVPVPVAVAPVNTQQQMLARAQTTLKSILPDGVPLCQGNDVGEQPGCVVFAGNQMIMHLNVKFIINRADIQDQYGVSIQSLGNFMNAYPNTSVVLYGYASSEGPLAFNQKLSARRAVSVKNYLVQQSNIAPSRIQTAGMGIQDPVASNATEQGRALNRRVEATVPVPAQLVQVNS